MPSSPADFWFDVFISYSSSDRSEASAIAERLSGDGLRVWFDMWELKPEDTISAQIEQGLERSRVLILCISERSSGSSWVALEANTFRFRDPLNKDRRLIPLRLDASHIKGSLAQHIYIDWTSPQREQEYDRLLMACRPPIAHAEIASGLAPEKTVKLTFRKASLRTFTFNADRTLVLSGGFQKALHLSDPATGRTIRSLRGHTYAIWDVAFCSDGHHAISVGWDCTTRLWDLDTGRCLRVIKSNERCSGLAWSPDGSLFAAGYDNDTIKLWSLAKLRHSKIFKGHTDRICSLAWSADGNRLLSGSADMTCRLWDVATGNCLRVFEGHSARVLSIALSGDGKLAVTGSDDNTCRIWDVETAHCLRVLEGHTQYVWSVALSSDKRWVLSGSFDSTVRLWDLKTGSCALVLEGHSDLIRKVAWGLDQRQAISCDDNGVICHWNLSEIIPASDSSDIGDLISRPPEQEQYTNAKVLVVGDTSSGKTGLAHRLATGSWKSSDGSTVGAWSTQWKLAGPSLKSGVEREIWLWDFGGQADQRLIHQLYMDRSALILLLFNADQEDVLVGLRDWQMALKRSIPLQTPKFIVAGRIDAGFKANRTKLRAFADEHELRYFETSAQDGTGCHELYEAIISTIPWESIPVTTTEHFFKLVKDEILKLRDEGQILFTFKELRDLLWHRLPKNEFLADDTLRAVIGHLDAPGVVKELDYGSYVLLAPEWINAYAQAVLRSLRSDESELGRLPLQSIAEGRLVYQSVTQQGGILEMKRLPPQSERVVLAQMERQLLERGLCVRQGDKLVFPSHCGRDRPAVVEHPSVFVSYAVKGYLDDIYSTLTVKLADSEAFVLKDVWRDAADFDTLEGGHRMGIKLTRESASSGDISVYFGPGVTQEEQVIFANYIHAHLESGSEQVQRLRYYVCPKCYTPKGNPQVLMEKLLSHRQAADTECDKCEARFPLWDALERKFASRSVREQVEGLQAQDEVRLDTRRKGKLLALEVMARITSADQKCFEIPGVEDEGLDVEVEFTDADGKGTGQRVYLQLKAGNSYLRRRRDGSEVFQIKKQAWVKYWLKQEQPVLLVIGTFPESTEEPRGGNKIRFADIRWMEIGNVLKRSSNNGKKPVKQIVFDGKRLDAMSVQLWRQKALSIQ